jgi:hypothetical protein
MLATDESDVLLELLHSRQQRRKILTSLGHLLSSLGHVILGLGRNIPSLRRLFLKRYVDDSKLIRLGTLLGQLSVGILNQSPLMRKHHPHIALMTNK